MIDGKIFLDEPIKNEIKHMTTFEKLQMVKEMILELAVC